MISAEGIFEIIPMLLPYVVVFLFVICFGTACFFVLYHLVRFGIGLVPKRAALVFFVGTMFLCAVALVTFVAIDWQHLFSIVGNSAGVLGV